LSEGMFEEMRRFFRRYLTPAVRWILFINVGILLLQFTLLLMVGWDEKFVTFFSQIPYYAVWRLQVWRFVTYMFLHGGGMHLLFNMLALWFFGPRLESRWGTGGFLKFYLICGIGAAVVHADFTLLFGAKGLTETGKIVRGMQMMVGASGAIYGVLLAYALYWPNETVLLNFFIPMKVKYMVLLFGVMEFLGTIGASGSRVSHITHLGGLLVAFLYLRGWQRFGKFGGGFFRRHKRIVKKYHRDPDGTIYVDYEEE